MSDVAKLRRDSGIESALCGIEVACEIDAKVFGFHDILTFQGELADRRLNTMLISDDDAADCTEDQSR